MARIIPIFVPSYDSLAKSCEYHSCWSKLDHVCMVASLCACSHMFPMTTESCCQKIKANEELEGVELVMMLLAHRKKVHLVVQNEGASPIARGITVPFIENRQLGRAKREPLNRGHMTPVLGNCTTRRINTQRTSARATDPDW